jgi:hypothetical protein
MTPLEMVRLPPLMALTSGKADVVVGLVDGPVFLDHPELASAHIRTLADVNHTCTQPSSSACQHATFVAGILSARRGSSAPAICPDCTLLVRPIFAETLDARQPRPSVTPQRLATAIHESSRAGVRVLNVSAAMAQTSTIDEPELRDALDDARLRAVTSTRQ